MRTRLYCLVSSILLLTCFECAAQKTVARGDKEVAIVIEAGANPRIEFGASKLSQVLKASEYKPVLLHQSNWPFGKRLIIVGTGHDSLVASVISISKFDAGPNTPKE
ncbi:MAG: hypothetical protein ACXVBF_10745, partial [Flavisolibacter sp.]